MKNAHLKTHNNLIFANIHRWYKIHTIKKINDGVLRLWNKNLAVIPELLAPAFQGAEHPVHCRLWEPHGQKQWYRIKKPLRTNILKTGFFRSHTDKRETQFCIFPTQREWYCILAFLMKMSNTKPSETLHTLSCWICWKTGSLRPCPLGEVLSNTAFKNPSVSLLYLLNFSHLKTQGTTSFRK